MRRPSDVAYFPIVLDLDQIEHHRFRFAKVVERDCCARPVGPFVVHRDIIGGDVPILRVDERKFVQIFVNLLSNAFKFTPAGGSVTPFLEIEPVLRELNAHYNGNYLNEASIVAAAHEVCPYSNATRGNVEVTLKANGHPVPTEA